MAWSVEVKSSSGIWETRSTVPSWQEALDAVGVLLASTAPVRITAFEQTKSFVIATIEELDDLRTNMVG